MAKESEHIELEGTIVNVGGGGQFRVQVSEDHIVLATLSGKIRKNKIKVVPGDKVTVKVSPYDPKRGIISFREK